MTANGDSLVGSDGTLPGLLRALAQTARGRTVVVDGDRRYAAAELHRDACQLAQALLRRGLRRHEPVAILARDCAAAVTTMFGIALARGVVAWLDPAAPLPELAAMLAQCGARTLFVDRARVSLAGELRDRCPLLHTCTALDEHPELPDLARFVAGAPSADPDLEPAPDEPVLWSPDRGGVLAPHLSLFALAAALREEALGNAPWAGDEVAVSGAPLAQPLARAWLCAMLAGSATVALHDGAADAMSWRWLARIRATRVLALPAQLGTALAPAGTATTVRTLATTWPVPASVLEAAIASAGATFVQCFGTPGAGAAVLWSRPAQHALGERAALLGRPLRGVTVEIRGIDGAALPSGERGELWLRSPAAALAVAGRDGWQATGRIASIDRDGVVRAD